MSKYDTGEYKGATEIVPGVFVDPPVEGAAVFIADEKGEIVMWNHDEIAEDPSGWTAALNAVALATKHGPEAVRRNLAQGGKVMVKLIEDTAKS